MFNFAIIVLLLSRVYSYEPFENPMCQDRSSSCVNLFGNTNVSDSCEKINHKVQNQTVCDSVYDEYDTNSNKNTNLGELILYPIYGDRRTIFNVTFVKIKFQKLKIRFQEYNNGAKVKDKCMVKEFNLQPNLTSNYTFSYVCPWSDSSFEGYEVEFDYDYGVDKYETRRKYKFMVPEYNSLMHNYENLYYFAFVDFTDLNNLILHINPMQNRFNITNYKVHYFYTHGNETSLLSSVNLTDIEHYTFHTYLVPGYYYFRIEPVSTICEENQSVCFVAETPKILIVPSSSAFLIGMVGVSLLIPIFVIIIYMWTKKWPGLPRPKPRVLLVTVPTNNAHIILAPVFAEFLRDTLNVEVLLDITDISKSSANNSLAWLNIALKNATHIVFLRSNDELNSNKVIYTDTYSQTMYLLDPQFCARRKKECILSFSYSSVTTDLSHPELAHIDKRFEFRNLNLLIKFLSNKNVTSHQIHNQTYQKLLDAIRDVENDQSEKRIKQIVDVNILVPIEENESYCSKEKFENDSHSENENPDIDISHCNLLGESDTQYSNEKNNYDSDLEDWNFSGNAENIYKQ